MSLSETGNQSDEVYIEVSSICNAKCIFCNYRFGYRAKKQMDIEIFRKLAQECHLLGYKKLNLTSLGGEFFTHPDALSIIKIAKDIGFKHIGTYTNGILISKFKLNSLLLSGLDTLRISFPGFNRDEYKLIYGVDKYDDFLNSILMLLESNHKSKKKINLIFEPRSRSSLKEIYENEIFKNKIEPYLSEFVTIVKPIVRYDSWGGEIKQSELPRGMKLEINPIKSIYPLKKVNLCSRITGIGILVNGDVRLCNCRYDSKIESSDELIIGNLNQFDSLQSLIVSNYEKTQKIKSDFINGKLPNLCKACTFYSPISRGEAFSINKIQD